MKLGQLSANTMRLQLVGLTLLGGQLSGCPPRGLLSAVRVLRGTLLDAESLEAPDDVVRMAAWTSTEGKFTGAGDGGRRVVPSPEDGAFELRLLSRDHGSFSVFASPSNLPTFPRPDEILVIVEREACKQQFTIEINEDTVVDLDFPDNVIDLKDPILVPPCAEGESGQ